eukprot:Opistho-1_new@13719
MTHWRGALKNVVDDRLHRLAIVRSGHVDVNRPHSLRVVVVVHCAGQRHVARAFLGRAFLPRRGSHFLRGRRGCDFVRHRIVHGRGCEHDVGVGPIRLLDNGMELHRAADFVDRGVLRGAQGVGGRVSGRSVKRRPEAFEKGDEPVLVHTGVAHNQRENGRHAFQHPLDPPCRMFREAPLLAKGRDALEKHSAPFGRQRRDFRGLLEDKWLNLAVLGAPEGLEHRADAVDALCVGIAARKLRRVLPQVIDKGHGDNDAPPCKHERGWPRRVTTSNGLRQYANKRRVRAEQIRREYPHVHPGNVARPRESRVGDHADVDEKERDDREPHVVPKVHRDNNHREVGERRRRVEVGDESDVELIV